MNFQLSFLAKNTTLRAFFLKKSNSAPYFPFFVDVEVFSKGELSFAETSPLTPSENLKLA